MPSSPLGMNSPHPSTTWLPMLAAWFLRHSRYLINGVEGVIAVICGAGAGTVLGGFDMLAIGVDAMPVVAIGDDELRSGSVL